MMTPTFKKKIIEELLWMREKFEFQMESIDKVLSMFPDEENQKEKEGKNERH